MIKVYGQRAPASISALTIGGQCPYCKMTTRFSYAAHHDYSMAHRLGAQAVIGNYLCDACSEPLPIKWRIKDWNGHQPEVYEPALLVQESIDYDLKHVPDSVEREIREALTCLSVKAYNGFAAMCRRTVQAVCEDIGTKGSSKVKKQIDEMAEMVGLEEEWKQLAEQVMLTGHDGAHPHLPTVDAARADLLLSLLQDLTYELYTRPGNVRSAADLRQEASRKGDA
jgi:hypothetical protein